MKEWFMVRCMLIGKGVLGMSDKIDTQGMSGPVDPNYKGPVRMQPHKPWEIIPRRCHTPQMVKELKILINEVMDEREGKFNYTSYFDVDKYKYYVGEEEPPYKP